MFSVRAIGLFNGLILKESHLSRFGCRLRRIHHSHFIALNSNNLLCRRLTKKYTRYNSTLTSSTINVETSKTLNDTNFQDDNTLNITSEVPPVPSVSNTETSESIATSSDATTQLPASSVASQPTDHVEGFVISDPTPISETITAETVAELTANGEPTLISQGLGGWSPSGMVQTALDALHTSCNLPWWLSIVIGTCVVRVVLFPLVITAQKNASRMNNYLPQMQVLQMKMSSARKSGNALMAAKYAQELVLFMKEKKLNPLKNMLVPMAQAPIFISCFFGLRGMANLPLESMKTGGLWWFTDLTVADPFYILPIATSVTLLVTLEIGAEGGLRADNMQMMRYILRGLPIVIFPFTMNFPAAILCYWTTSNFISLFQVAFLKIPAVREYFQIEKLVRHDPKSLPIPKKGFVEGLKDSYGNTKVLKELENRMQYDEMQFRKAGMGPIQKTYPFDPTKQSTAASAKPRDSK